MLVFDPLLWKGKDVGDNSQFWKRAEILRIYGSASGLLADVKFEYDNRVSRAHFVCAMKAAQC